VTEYPGDGPIERVETRDGRVLDCDALFVAVGTRPNAGLADAAGLDVEQGVVVNDRMQTSDPAVYAIGEIAEHEGERYGITPAANEQADVAAAHLAGEAWSRYDGSLNFNILKISGLEVRSMGTVQPPEDDEAYEEIVFLDRRHRCYKKCVVHNNRLVGAVLIGDATGFADFKYLIDEGMELNGRRSELLRPGASEAADPPEGELVCSCNSVGAGNLETLIDDGCTELDQLRQKSRAGTGCGSCIPEVKRILEDTCEEACVPA
jgi:ferredoxin-nitrate reductase